jgi:hypothetical protein
LQTEVILHAYALVEWHPRSLEIVHETIETMFFPSNAQDHSQNVLSGPAGLPSRTVIQSAEQTGGRGA